MLGISILVFVEFFFKKYQVVVRMRPPRKDKEEEDTIVQKISTDSLTINGQTFTFDSVADTEATQVSSL